MRHHDWPALSVLSQDLSLDPNLISLTRLVVSSELSGPTCLHSCLPPPPSAGFQLSIAMPDFPIDAGDPTQVLGLALCFALGAISPTSGGLFINVFSGDRNSGVELPEVADIWF